MSVETSTLTDDVRAAMTEAGGEQETSTATQAEVTTTETAAPAAASESTSSAADRVRDEKGRFKAKDGEGEQPAADATATAAPAKPTETVVKPPAAAVETATPAPQAPETTPDLRPPGRWPVAAREAWSKVPPEVRQVVHQREKEIAVALQRTAKEREYAEKVRETFAPFDSGIRANGGDTLQAASAALQMLHRLTYGHDQEKATLLAGIVKRFRVSVEALDQALVGAATPAGGSQPQSVDPAQIEQRVMQRLMAQRQEAIDQRAREEMEALESDPAFEFLEEGDIRIDMAHELQKAAARGKAMSPKEAYDIACKKDEMVGRIVSQRAEAAKAKLAPARQAVKQPSSLKSDAPVVQNGARKSGSTRDDVEAALADLSAR